MAKKQSLTWAEKSLHRKNYKEIRDILMNGGDRSSLIVMLSAILPFRVVTGPTKVVHGEIFINVDEFSSRSIGLNNNEALGTLLIDLAVLYSAWVMTNCRDEQGVLYDDDN